MKFVLENNSKILVHSYDVGAVSISGIPPEDPQPGSGQQNEKWNEWDSDNQLGIFRQSIILRSSGLIQSWAPQDYAALEPLHFNNFVSEVSGHDEPEIVLIGTGRNLRFPPQDCLSTLQQQNLGYEIMDTAAACRTFNVLAAESRNVLMALLMIEVN